MIERARLKNSEICVRARARVKWNSVGAQIYRIRNLSLPDLNKNRKETNRFTEVLLSIQI